MASTIISFTETFVTLECCQCHMLFAVDQRTKNRWVDTGESFYCPSGHSQCFCDTTVKRLQRENAALKQQADQKDARLRDAREAIALRDRQLSAAKGQQTRLKKRIGAGVCPCCHRTFKQLAAHMHDMHPEFAKQVDAASN